jgi:anti-sigma regulatory factor (Ser/Thr protein kinase)/anti-anti-sigma regulatory factor
MIWNILFQRELEIVIPRTLNADTMFTFVDGAIDEQRDARSSKVALDFGSLEFIEPVGVVILSNLIEYLRKCGVKVVFKNHTARTVAIKFLDDSQFFVEYERRAIFQDCAVRPSTIPLNRIHNDRSQEFLLHKLMPWIAKSVGLTAQSLVSTKVALEEILHNVRDHSGVQIGCTFAQYFPNKNRIQIAISDFGCGIPEMVRTKLPDVSDTHALRLACQEGFTTKTNVQNRGAGLPTLMRYVTQRNGGNVLLVSGKGALSASPINNGKTKMTPRQARGSYPGTLVRVILRTDTLERAAEDAELEPFEW